MSLKLKALLILVGTICIAVAGILTLDYIVTNVAMETIKTALAGIIGVILLYFMYGIILGRLEYEQMVEETRAKYNKKDTK